MKIAVMQPYFFPYLGYFQLIRSVDAFVIYDDGRYIKEGWINRNYILHQGKRQWITLAIRDTSCHRRIHETVIFGRKQKILRAVRHNYSRAPFYQTVYPLIEAIICCEENNLATYLERGLKMICGYLNMHPEWLRSSQFDVDTALPAQVRLVEICRQLQADRYINLSGGMKFYNKDDLAAHGVRLSFIKQNDVRYTQFDNAFVPSLSIIDVLMFNSQDRCREMLNDYTFL